MSLMGQCYVCGRPSTLSCKMCGKIVCPEHADRYTGLCQACTGGKRGRGRDPSSKDRFMQ